MKFRTTLLVSALVALSACGGSSDSASRNRNGLLDATTVPVAATLPSAPTTTGLPILVPVPTSSSTTSAPTTTIAQVVVEASAKTFKDAFSRGDCGRGGMCQISSGEERNTRGPKGGWIIGISEAGFSTKDPAVSNHFLEMGPPVKVRACNEAIGPKSTTSQELTRALIDTRCVNTPALRDDWYIPGDEEIQYVLDFYRDQLATNSRQAQPFREAFYQRFLTTSTTCGLGTTFFFPLHDFVTKPVTCPSKKGLSALSRDTWITPVRSFGPTVRACALGGPCKTGDVGPTGGIVINSGIADGSRYKFFEAMTSPEYLRVGAWCGPFYDSIDARKPESGLLNTASLFSDGTSGLPCDVVLGADNRTDFSQSLTTMDRSFFVPATWELKLLCTATQTMKRLDSLARRQCGISKDFNRESDLGELRKTSICPISIYCKNENGEFAKQEIDFVWTSSLVRAGSGRIIKEDGLINAWSFRQSIMVSRAMYKVNRLTENTSRGITLPFREFTALVAK